MTKYLELNNIGCYKKAFMLSNYVWDVVITWDYFAKTTIGQQYARAIDSISANIAEGFGRYLKKDKIRFYIISQGSLRESMDWTKKAYRRKLITSKEYEYILGELKQLPIEINQLVKFTREKLTI